MSDERVTAVLNAMLSVPGGDDVRDTVDRFLAMHDAAVAADEERKRLDAMMAKPLPRSGLDQNRLSQRGDPARFQAVVDLLRDHPAVRGYPDHEHRQYEAARFLAMFDVAVEHAFRQWADELREMFGSDEPAAAAPADVAPTRATPETVEFAALRRLMTAIHDYHLVRSIDASKPLGRALVDAIAYAQSVVDGVARKP